MAVEITVDDSKLLQILNRSYLGKYSKCCEFGPAKYILPAKFEQDYDKIQNFDVRDDDVFVLAFPKSGTRWTLEMVWLLLNNLDFNRSREISLSQRAPLLELEAAYVDSHFEGKYLDKLVGLENPRCIGSHLEWSLLPKALTSGAKLPKIVVILRGPEDTCVSFYYHAKAFGMYTGTWEEFCDYFLEGKVLFGPYWEYVLNLWEQRHRSNILFIKYNEMKADLTRTVREVSLFLDKKLSDDDVAKMCEHLAFTNLKENPGFNMNHVMKYAEGNINPFIRSGAMNDHKNRMSSEAITAFKHRKEHHFHRVGLSLD